MKNLLMLAAAFAWICGTAAISAEKTRSTGEPARSATIGGGEPNRSTVAVRSNNRLDLSYESFEDAFPPDGWRTMTSGASYTWVQSSEQVYAGISSAYLEWGSQGAWQDEWLVTPALDSSGFGALFLEFYETGAYWDNWGWSHEILVSTTVADDPAAFTSIWTVTPDSYSAPWLNSAGGEWGLVELSLAEYIGDTIYLAIRYQGEYADDWWVDDFRIFEPSDHDVKAAAVMPDGDVWYEGSEVMPQFKIKNVGLNTETFDAALVIEHDGVPFYSETVEVTLASDEETVVDYPVFVTEVGAYDLTGILTLPGDEAPDNNEATASNLCYYARERVPFAILYTNWASGLCFSANQALDYWYPQQGNTASLIRVHVWWPGNDDPMYHANPDQNTFLVDMCFNGLSEGIPALIMDNAVDMWDHYQGNWLSTIEYGYEMSAMTPPPLTIEINYDPEASKAQVQVNVDNEMPSSDYVLYVAVTEDGVEATGPNGLQFHNQTFRRLYPDEDGLPVSSELGVQDFLMSLDLDPEWVFGNLRATTWVQRVPGGPVQNSATMFLIDGTLRLPDDISGVGFEPEDTPQLATCLQSVHPNPFNPQTTITFTLGKPQRAKIAVYDLTGRLMGALIDRNCAAGTHSTVWNGVDAMGRAVPSGTYVIRLETESDVGARKVILIR